MSPLARLADSAVHAYQMLLRPVLPPVCRFTPSCSEYAREAFSNHGFAKGSWLALRRIGRCHPFHPGGFDPPPPGRRAAEETES